MTQFFKQFLLLTFFLGGLFFINAQQRSSNPIRISDNPTDFMNSLHDSNDSGKNSQKVTVKVSNSETVSLKLNKDYENGTTRSLIGSLEGKKNAYFGFRYNKGRLEGHIVEQSDNRAYEVYTTSNGNVFVKETDIDAVLCIAFDKANEATGKKSDVNSTSAKMPPLTLQSRPSATAVIYLDFDGETVSNTFWNRNNNGNTINAQASGLSDEQIITTWEIMAEDFSPFDVNVVTDRSVFDATPRTRRMMCIFTPTDTAQPNSGGVAFLDSFTWNTDDPCWVYNIGNGKQAGDTGSHEVGHTLGLGHDGKGMTEYYEGHNNWGPIMGFSLNKPIAQWSRGEYSNASNTQNDLLTIGSGQNNFSLVPDDHGDTTNTATELEADGSGAVTASQNTGIVHKLDDIDLFSFLAETGEATFTFNANQVHPNLDIQARLLDSDGAEVVVSNPSGLSASLSANLIPGLYFLEVQGVGAGTVDTGYSDYASLGQYSISGQYSVQTPQNDLSLLTTSLKEGAVACGSITPTVELANNGQNAISDFDISYRINQGAKQTQSFSNPIASQETITVALEEIVLTSSGDTVIEIIAEIENDDLPNNNSIEKNFFSNISGVASQVNTFESANDELITYGIGNASIWERGQPTGQTLGSPNSGTRVYGTVLSGNHPDSNLSYLVTNCYDFTSIQSPILKFEMAFDLEINFDILYVEYSLDTGSTWSHLGTSASQPNWYNSDRTNASSGPDNDCQNCPGGQWTGTQSQFTQYSYDFEANAANETDLSDEASIMFRLVFHSDEFVNQEGVVIDDLVIDGVPVDDNDDDNDGILDDVDNCPMTSNADQLDTDGDMIGDVCDDDDDNDGVLDVNDNCPLTPNPDQADLDGDGIGDVCEDPNDLDGDGIVNLEDNCAQVPNENQKDNDGDGIGDACDPDDDNDGIPDSTDNCTMFYNPEQVDTDNDGIGDVCDKDDDEDGILDEEDNCNLVPNPGQEDSDNDGIGDVCDSSEDDVDSDGITNTQDNCVNIPNPDQKDTDGDGMGDVCDPDDDNDGILDIVDNCPLQANTDQADSDNDGIGDTCDEGFSLPDSNYSFSVKRSCETNTATLKVEALEDYQYQATLSRDEIGLSKDFSGEVLFEDLDAGVYTLCITVDGEMDYVACFDITIDAFKTFSVTTELNLRNNEVNLFLEGSENYTITLNEETQIVSDSEATLPLTNNTNVLRVVSDNACDEVFEETILLMPEVSVYPNPVAGEAFTIALEGGVESAVVVSMFTVQGTRVSSKRYEIANNEVHIDVSGLAQGIYIVNVSTSNSLKTYKIIRN